MRITLLGFGRSNRAVLNSLRNEHEFFVSDINLTDEKKRFLESIGVEYETFHTERILKSDIILVSPGISPHSEVGKMVRCSDVESIVDIDFYFRIKRKPSIVIGVTGTNGKTTTASLICHVIKNSGKRCAFLGNNETPVFSFDGTTDVMVLEISSFQLYWSKNIPLDVGVLLNIAPDHLNWHKNFSEYLEAKKKILTFSKTKIVSEDIIEIKEFNNIKIFNAHTVDLEKLPAGLKSVQNVQNVAAALAVVEELGIKKDDFYRYLSDFEIPPHRMEIVVEYKGVRFYNDSKATNTHATIKALENFDRVVLILSGIIKEEDLRNFVRIVEKKAEKVILLGKRIKEKLHFKDVKVESVSTMDEAVKEAFESAKNGVVLFSPAGASFDMYRSYRDRGEDFKRAVRRLMGDG